MSVDERTDAVLVPLAQNGDLVACAALFQRYRADMYAVAVRVLRDREEAADAVQDTFLTCMVRIDSVRDPAAIGGWLRAVVMNTCRMRLRRQRPVTIDQFPDLPDSGADPEQVIIDRRLRDWIWSALESLSEEDRVTLLLRHFTRCTTYQAIAEVTGVPVGTVRSRLHRAHAQLAEALQRTESPASHDQRRLETERRAAWTDFYQVVLDSPEPATYRRMFHPDVRVNDSGPILSGIAEWVAEERPAIELGVRATVIDVAAASDLTILEIDFTNPREAPRHCPPRSTFVHRLRDGRTARLDTHYYA